MENEIASRTEKPSFFDRVSPRGRLRIISSIQKAMNRFHRGERGEEGIGCGIVLAIGAVVIGLSVWAARTTDLERGSTDMERRVAAVETAVAAIHTPTATPTLTPYRTPIR